MLPVRGGRFIDDEGNPLVIEQWYFATDDEGDAEDYKWQLVGIENNGTEQGILRFRNPMGNVFDVNATGLTKLEPDVEVEEIIPQPKSGVAPPSLFQVKRSATQLRGSRVGFDTCFVRDPGGGANCGMLTLATLGLIHPKDIDFFIQMMGGTTWKTIYPVLSANLRAVGEDPRSLGSGFYEYSMSQFSSVFKHYLRPGYVTGLFISITRGGAHMAVLERLDANTFRVVDQQNVNRPEMVAANPDRPILASVVTGSAEHIQSILDDEGYDRLLVIPGPALDALNPPRLIDMTPGVTPLSAEAQENLRKLGPKEAAAQTLKTTGERARQAFVAARPGTAKARAQKRGGAKRRKTYRKRPTK